VALVSDDVWAFVAGSLGVVIIVLLALVIWRHGGPHDPEP
jgi:hypothetical protein